MGNYFRMIILFGFAFEQQQQNSCFLEWEEHQLEKTSFVFTNALEILISFI